MRPPEITHADIMRVAIQQEIVRSNESRYDHRLHGVLLVGSGLRTYELAELFGQSARTVQYRVQRFERRGLAGPQEIERPGRPARLAPATLQQVGKGLRRDPPELGYAQTLWDGKLLSHHLDATYHVYLGVRQCQRLFARLGFRRRKLRPVIAQADPAAERTFKNSGASREAMKWTSGAKTNATSSSTVRAERCGYLPKTPTRSFCTRLRATVWRCSAPSVSKTDVLFRAAPTCSTLPRSKTSWSNSCAIVVRTERCSSL